MILPLQEKRILAIDPTNRSFGFAVMEGPDLLIDWGVKDVKDNDNYRYLRKVADLIDFYQPNALVLEDVSGKGSRRGGRVKELIQETAILALNKKMSISHISRLTVKKFFEQFGATTKHQIAKEIARQFSELNHRLPPYRKPWMSEDYRMGIFDSVAFALAFYHVNETDASTQ